MSVLRSLDFSLASQDIKQGGDVIRSVKQRILLVAVVENGLEGVNLPLETI